MIRRAGLATLAMAMAACAGAAIAAAPATPASMPLPAVDYADRAAWVCRPDIADSPCTGNLDAVRIAGDGSRHASPYVAAAAPSVDCFYIYPTASLEPSEYSDIVADAAVKAVVRAQAGRLGARCRVFAPAYRQVTMPALQRRLAKAPPFEEPNLEIPYRDVRAAWRAYLAHDNHGRGVVIVGHSQGSRLLKRLLAEEVDGRPARRLLVAAYLGGNPDLDVASFRTIAPCGAADQTGCIVAWSSYAADYGGARRFGADRGGHQPLCVNPAALAGGRGLLHSFLPQPGGAPFLEVSGLITGECVVDNQGAVLRIRVEPGAQAALLAAALVPSRAGPSWGLHPLDIALVEGDLLDLIARQSAAWSSRQATGRHHAGAVN